MARQPDDRDTERDHKDKKYDPPFSPFLAQRDAPAAAAVIVGPPLVLERDRHIEPAAPFRGPIQKLFALPARVFLGHARRFRDHPLELFHFAPQLRFALGEFFLFLVERRSLFRRSAAHAGSLSLRGNPEKNEQRHHAKNYQWQRHRETDLDPLRE